MAQFFTVSTESDSYSYFIKGADPRSGYNNNRYWKYNGSSAIVHTTTVPGTSDDAYKFKIYASTTNGKYYIYSVGAQQYLYCKNTGAGKDRVGLKTEKADDALWYIANDGIGPNGIINIVPGSLSLGSSTVGWNIHGGVDQTEYIGLYDRTDQASQWSLIPSDLTTLNNFRSIAATFMQGDTPDYSVSKPARPNAFPTADYASWTIGDATSIVSSLNGLYPALPTGYYTIKNCATDRKQYIYGDITNNPNGYTLQSATRVFDMRGWWKVTNNGNGTIDIVNSNGDPIITMDNNAPTLYKTLHMANADGKNGIYFTEAINASNGGTKVNNIPCLTTWATGGINAPDNRWEFSETNASPYTINIYAPSNYKLGWRNRDSESEYTMIKKGGFFVDIMDVEGSMSMYEFVLLDENGSVVSGVTPVVDAEARTITATLSELPSGYYRVVSAFTGGTAAAKGWTSSQGDSKTLGWEVADANNGEQYWHIEGNATNGYTIRSAYFDCKKYIALSASKNQGNTSYSLVDDDASASTFTINLIANSDQYKIQAKNNSYPVHGRFMVDSWSAGPFTTWAGDANSASAWYFVPATDLEAAVASLNTYTAGVDFSKQVGTKVGQYSEPEGTTTEGLQTLTSNYATYKSQVAAALASGDVATMETAYNNFKTNVKDLITTERTTAYGTLVINQPEAGKLYRFKNKAANRYMKENGKDQQMNMTDITDLHSSIFMLREGNDIDGKKAFKLLSYTTGYYTKNTRENGATANNANSVLFKESEAGNLGYYTLKTTYTAAPYIFGRTDNNLVDRNGTYQANNCDWQIEEVTWLPIPISDVYKFATFYSPVDLAISDTWYSQDARLKFYTATIGTDGYVELKKVTDNIPANQPYVVEHVSDYKNNCSYMKIASSAPELTAPNALRGGFETVAKPTNEGTIYTLQAAWDEETDNNLSATEVAFRQYNGATIKGFRAYLPVPGNARIAGMRIVDGDVTRIEGVNAEESHKVDVYDLSGRRVQRATKGLYIINGKKVIVK